MRTEILSIGNELVTGMSDSSFIPVLARACSGYGYDVVNQTVTGEEEVRVKRALERALKQADMILVLTRTELHSVVKDAIQTILGEFSIEKEICFKKGEKRILLLPVEKDKLMPMFYDLVLPDLKEWTDRPVYSKLLKFVSLSEDDVKDRIQDFLNAENAVSIRVAAYEYEVWLYVESAAPAMEEAKENVKHAMEKLKKRFRGEYYSSKEEESLEESVVKLLWKHELKFVTAESITGGMIASTIVNVPGASDALKESFVTYSNKAKHKYLDVSKDTLLKYTEYSEKCAKEMARGAALRTNSDVAVATSGIAGPGGGTKEKPVGLVYIACFAKDKVTVKEFHFKGNREQVRKQSCIQALELARICMLERY